MKKKLIITLKSDLCVSSGYSYAGIIDSDVCYDKYGLPFIPARRLKGCFRDTAEKLLYNIVPQKMVDELFGTSGSDIGGVLKISNARLCKYESIKKELIALKKDKEIGHVISRQNVLEQYTHIIAQTAIGEDSSAEDNSLRYTRVVNHYIPAQNGVGYDETVFETTVEFEENESNSVAEYLELIFGATKNIGLKRNRGFGAVSCSLTDCTQNEDKKEIDSCLYKDDEEYVISYTLINDDPLMLSQLSDTHSEKHINGQTILGHLAGVYLKMSGKTSETEEFKDLFLNGTTKYVNAYPAIDDSRGNLHIYYPAPLNINKLKKTGDYVDTFYSISEDKITPGNQPKKLKGKYLHQDIKEEYVELSQKEVNMKLNYHHRRGEDGILYPSEAIEPDQIFAGEIYTRGRYIKIILSMLSNGELYFGKSKHAQYGHCRCSIHGVKPIKNVVKYNQWEKLQITLLTDAIFVDSGEYTVELGAVLRQLREQIKGTDKDSCDVIMETGLVSGYQTKWNMHKPIYPIVKAGSCFVLDCQNCKELPERIWIGTKNQEGYGYASVIPMKKRDISFVESDVFENDAESKIDKASPQIINMFKKELLDKLKLIPFDLKGVSKTQIGRAILMLKQCKNFSDFIDRVDSIKTDSVRRIFTDKLIKTIDDNGKPNIKKLIKENSTAEKYYYFLVNKADLSDLWKDYLLYNLVLCKYEAMEV